MARAQRLRQLLRVGRRMAAANEAARDFGGRAFHRFRIERVATEEVDLLQLREQSRARVTARNALHFVDRQRFPDVQPIRIELVAVIEMPRDEQDVAADALAAGRRQPIGASVLDQFDELELVGGQPAAKRFFFVRGIDGDRADGLPVGVGRVPARR